MLSARHRVLVFEGEGSPGGLVRCGDVNGILYHKVGGHVFNSRRADVLHWFWGQFDRERDFLEAERNAVISMPDGSLISYPIENHLYQLPNAVQKRVLDDLLKIYAEGYGEPRNFDEFLKRRFGETLYNAYFAPYNAKIWKRLLTDVPLCWLKGKLPMPTVSEILLANISKNEERTMVHSTFHYARRGGSQFLADTLANGLNILYHSKIERIARTCDGWNVAGRHFDCVIFSGNLKMLPDMIGESVDLSNEIQAIQSLESHGTTSVLCSLDSNPYSWIYLPDSSYKSHRIICTGNFSPWNAPPGQHTATIEFSECMSRDEIEKEFAKMPFHPRYLAHHWEEYTYPIQTGVTRRTVLNLKNKLSPLNFFLLGRFAEWEYYNMDAAIGAALDLTRALEVAEMSGSRNVNVEIA